MRTLLAMAGLALILTGGCRGEVRNEQQPAAATPRPAANAVQDLSKVKTEVTITPMIPPFVQRVALLRNGAEETADVLKAASTDRLEQVVYLREVPTGLAIRSELLDEKDQPMQGIRQMPLNDAREIHIDVPLKGVKAGNYRLRTWSGGDLVAERRLRID